MRDEADSNLIELLDADPLAFDVGATSLAVESRAPRPRWLAPTAVALTVAVATVGVLVWRPWHHEPEPPLSNRLLLDRPTSAVLDVSVDRVRPPVVTADPGFVFAEDGAVLSWLGPVSGRSLVWTAYPVDSANAAYSSIFEGGRTAADLQGAPAYVWNDSETVRVVFGPVEGRMFDVSSSGLTEDETIAMARAIGVERGQPVLRGDGVLDLLGLRPVGSYDDLNAAMGLVTGGLSAPTATARTSVGYVDGTGGQVRVSSLSDSGDGPLLRMLRALLGPSGTATVHRREAIATDIKLAFSDDLAPDNLVAWHEGGRLIVVTGSADLATVVDAAETVHEATDDEWRPVAAQADTDGYFYYPSTIGYRPRGDGSITEVSGSSYRLGSVTVCLLDQFSTGTDCAMELEMRLPFLKVMRIHTVALVVAMVVADAVEPQLRITHSDGSVDVHVLFAPGTDLPGPAVAVFLPDDLREAALVVDGAVVATL